jgi:Archaea-specific editing domain of threonyl-tRNA synthetase
MGEPGEGTDMSNNFTPLPQPLTSEEGSFTSIFCWNNYISNLGNRPFTAMKLLMFYSPEFWVRPFEKAVPDAPDPEGDETFREAVVIFYHAEAEDAGREDRVIAKWVKNAKWLAGKFATRTVVLHSFNHLSASKASADSAALMRDEVRSRLERTGYTVFETPFGWQNEWKLHVSGESLAKVFKEI